MRKPLTPAQHPLDPLVSVMAKLRGPGGCPWDREQDHHTLKKYLIEEAYEVLDAIDQGDDRALVEELGDVLLQVVFHSQIASETGRFDIDDVVAAITEKLIRRHPHVFGDADAPDAETVLQNWEKLKQAEKAEQGQRDKESVPSLLDGIPKHLPALMLAADVQKRAAKVGFEWEDAQGALDKVEEEWRELNDARESGDRARLFEEWGDLFFALVNVARYDGIDPEEALRQATKKFERRFRFIEAQAAKSQRDLAEMSLEEMDALWDEAKRLEDEESSPRS
ncbi:MAG TPA: nucleoside triphosphate pyrophosphohydrolase [Limnochordia bacterium]|nr:nucleoside triphosphate pyrophosphohydrolase [Limnochordia bacterium]